MRLLHDIVDLSPEAVSCHPDLSYGWSGFERAHEMAQLHIEGEKMNAIGRRFGISGTRVSQCIERYFRQMKVYLAISRAINDLNSKGFDGLSLMVNMGCYRGGSGLAPSLDYPEKCDLTAQLVLDKHLADANKEVNATNPLQQRRDKARPNLPDIFDRLRGDEHDHHT